MAKTYAGNIRYHTTLNQWQFANDGLNYEPLASLNHTHTSDDITNCTIASKSNTIPLRDGFQQLNASAFNTVKSSLKEQQLNISAMLAGANSDPEEDFNVGIVINTAYSKAKLLVDDGASFSMLWNASSGREVGNKGVRITEGGTAKMELDADDYGLRYGLYGAKTDATGSQIASWAPELTIQDNVFTLYRHNLPYGSPEAKLTVEANGDLILKETAFAKEFKTASHSSYKENIKLTEADALAEINALDIYEYNYKDDEEKKPRIGILADEVSNALISGANHDTFSVSNTVGYLIKAVQQLTARLESTEEELKALKEKYNEN